MADDPATPPRPDAEKLQGVDSRLDSPHVRDTVLDQALGYRGDVTIHTVDGQVIEGYVFDRRRDVPQPFVRLILSASAKRLDIPDVNIARLVFSGRDTAAGKSWETWVKKYQEKRAAGLPANIESEPLE